MKTTASNVQCTVDIDFQIGAQRLTRLPKLDLKGSDLELRALSVSYLHAAPVCMNLENTIEQPRTMFVVFVNLFQDSIYMMLHRKSGRNLRCSKTLSNSAL